MSIRSTGLRGLWKDVKRDRWLYVFLIPAIVYFFIFHYIPMYGLKIAFYDYNAYAPEKSEFVGFQKIIDLFKKDQFLRALKNTVWISLLKLLIGFPAPIILALLLNEMLNLQYKRVSQTLLYLPHFVSWVVLGGILMDLLDPTRGFITQIINRATGEEIQVLTDNRYFVPMLVISQLYKEVGWGTILYLAAISGIDPQLYEAAAIDGAGRWKMALHITLPALIPTMVVVFTLNLGGVLRAALIKSSSSIRHSSMKLQTLLTPMSTASGLRRATTPLVPRLGCSSLLSA